jgi:CTP:molybdopterin cytidylyltransferase MocA
MCDFQGRRLIATSDAAQATDQSVEVAVFHAIDAPQVRKHPVARLAHLVAVGLDDLQVAPLTALIDPNKHAYKIRV